MSFASSSAVRSDTTVYVDTHCHLDDEAFANDVDEVLDRSRRSGVTRWINVGYCPDRWLTSVDLAKRNPGMKVMLGLHPGNAGEWSTSVHADLRELVANVAPVAIGEIGLDFFRGETNVVEQQTAFIEQLELARTANLPACIHMRDAENEVLQVLDSLEHLPTLLFHSFDGSERMTKWIEDHDAWIGVGGLASRRKSEPLRQQIKRLGIDRIVLETDSPYLVPDGFKHRRNTPESIPCIARNLGDLLQLEVETVANCTTANAHRVFSRMAAS